MREDYVNIALSFCGVIRDGSFLLMRITLTLGSLLNFTEGSIMNRYLFLIDGPRGAVYHGASNEKYMMNGEGKLCPSTVSR